MWRKWVHKIRNPYKEFSVNVFQNSALAEKVSSSFEITVKAEDGTEKKWIIDAKVNRCVYSQCKRNATVIIIKFHEKYGLLECLPISSLRSVGQYSYCTLLLVFFFTHLFTPYLLFFLFQSQFFHFPWKKKELFKMANIDSTWNFQKFMISS